MDEDIRNQIDDEIEGIVYDDNDTDADIEAEGAETKENETSQTEETDEEREDSDPEQKEQAEKAPVIVVPEIERPGRKRKKTINNKRLLFILPAIAVILAGMITLYVVLERNARYRNLLDVDYFYEGIYVDGISLGGLTYEQAKEKIEDSNRLRTNKAEVVLLWDGEKITFGSDELNISFDTENIIDKALQEGRSGTDKERYDYVLSLIENPVEFATSMTIDPSPIEAKVKAVVLFKQRDPGEAAVQFNPDPNIDSSEWFVYSEPESGIETDPEAVWKDVKEMVKQTPRAQVAIEKQEIEPTVTLEDLKSVTQPILKEPFTTHMIKNSNREHNVALACSMINGTVVMPGEIFSMNETTGKRTKEAGYKEANVIVSGNRLEPGIAGGVCQVSGTLFNAAVRADLEIIERHHHSFELSYLTRGRDATVNYGTADLRFKNTTDYPIYISMYTIDRDVYAQIYGVPLADGMSIELYVKTIKTIAPGPTVYIADSSIPPWESPEVYSARTGISCVAYKDYYDAAGKLIERVELHRDYYSPMAKEVRYNPAAGIPKA